MARMMVIGRGGAIDIDRVIALMPARSAPVKRLLAQVPQQVINMTYGYPRRSVILLDNGYFVLTSLTVAQLVNELKIEERATNVEDPISW
jgi:regulator of extracellular matrix RemA (YlzA/DUF370 family)